MALPVREPLGRPISDEDRKKRTLSHLLHYGIKMMVRRDLGGSTEIANHANVVAQQLVGLTAAQAGEKVVQMQSQLVQGVKDRQRRSVDEIERRGKFLLEMSYRAAQKAKTGDNEAAFKLCQNGINEMLGGEKLAETATPETHILE